MNKKLFTMIAVLGIAFGLSNTAKAQASASLSPVTVNVKLADVIGIEPSTGAASILFEYNGISDYNADKSATVPRQFKVTSTRSYNLSVKAAGDFVGSAPEKKLSLNILRVAAKKNSEATFPTETAISSSTSTLLVSSAAPTLAADYDIAYKILSSSELVGKDEGTYTATLTYTVTAL